MSGPRGGTTVRRASSASAPRGSVQRGAAYDGYRREADQTAYDAANAAPRRAGEPQYEEMDGAAAEPGAEEGPWAPGAEALPYADLGATHRAYDAAERPSNC